VALLAPEHQHRHLDLAWKVGAVVLEVDGHGRAIVLAHGADVLGVAAADVFGHRFGREGRRPTPGLSSFFLMYRSKPYASIIFSG
jgi:hypothetical protein